MSVTGKWSLVAILGLWAASVQAQEVQWRPARSTAPTEPAVSGTGLRLGRPVPLMGTPPESATDDQIQQTAFAAPGPLALQTVQPLLTGQAGTGVPTVPPPALPGAGGPAGVPPPPEENYNCAPATTPTGGGVGGFIQTIITPVSGRALFQSDHCFDGFVAPVTNPFYFIDPRSSTEARPIFIFQQTPKSTPVFAGGDIVYAGVYGSVALTDRLSFIVEKLGWIWEEAHNGTPALQSHDGFAELHLGAQYTLIRNEKAEGFLPGQTLLTAGLIFEIPAGPAKVAQNTGSLSLTPYMSFGQEFGRTDFGTFHFLNTTGFSLSVDKSRTDFLYSSFHLDFGVGPHPVWYPFVELNWFLYAKSGDSTALGFEGRDLFNFGSTNVGGHNDLSIAVGTRYKICEWFQLGGAIEFPLLNRKDLMNYRLTFDMIFRY